MRHHYCFFCGGPLVVEAPGQLPSLPPPLNPALEQLTITARCRVHCSSDGPETCNITFLNCNTGVELNCWERRRTDGRIFSSPHSPVVLQSFSLTQILAMSALASRPIASLAKQHNEHSLHSTRRTRRLRHSRLVQCCHLANRCKQDRR